MSTQGSEPGFSSPRVRRETALLAGDLAAASGTIAAALLLRFRFEVPPQHALPYLTALPLLVGFRLMAAYAFGLYDLKHRLTAADHFFGGVAAAVTGVALGYLAMAMGVLYYAPDLYLSRLVALTDLALLAGWFAGSRALALRVLTARGDCVRVLLLGPSGSCADLGEEVREHAPPLLRVAGVVATDKGTDEAVARLAREVAGGAAEQVILVDPPQGQRHLGRILEVCDHNRVETYLYPPLDYAILTNTHMASIAGVPLLSLRPALAHTPYRAGKRILDVTAAAALLAPLAPLAVAAAALVKLTSPGPALFGQERVGRFGRTFRLWKLRTMVADAEAATGPALSVPGDPRVTPVGRVLRRLRLDEAPQLWNVLRGDMSLVGPRPERPEFVAGYERENPLYERRAMVRPGLTGLAQVHGRYDTDYTHKLRYDLTYVNSVSLATDLRILFATIRTVLTGRGAR